MKIGTVMTFLQDSIVLIILDGEFLYELMFLIGEFLNKFVRECSL